MVLLGLDGGTTSTICVCIPLSFSVSDDDDHVPPVLGRAVAGCSNHNSVGGSTHFCFLTFVGSVWCC